MYFGSPAFHWQHLHWTNLLGNSKFLHIPNRKSDFHVERIVNMQPILADIHDHFHRLSAFLLATRPNMDDHPMTWQEGLEITIRKTGSERFRVLCSESWPDYLAYRQLMIKLAKDDFGALEYPSLRPTLIPLPESLTMLRLVDSCPYRSRDTACGCSGHRCALRPAVPIVSHLDCLDCVKRYG
jgi:hypothetical protein